MFNGIRHKVLPAICGDILRYIAYAILLTRENVCDIDIAYPNIAYCPTLVGGLQQT